MELSAIFAQSLIIVNFPWGSKKERIREKRKMKGTSKCIHDDTILSDLYMIAYGRSFYDGICTDVNVVTNLHRVIVECTTVCLVRRPERTMTK